MINIETVRFIKMIEELTELSKAEIIPFCECNEAIYHDHITYDENKKNDNGTYKIPLDACLAPDHHDIIDYYDDFCYSDNYIIGVRIDEDGDKFVDIFIDDQNIVIENGRWYFA